jgi:hypothetical protein
MMHFGILTINLIVFIPVAVWGLGVHTLRPFKVDLSAGVPHLRELVEITHLPEYEVNTGVEPSAGISLDTLKSLQDEWLTSFDWDREQEAINK